MTEQDSKDKYIKCSRCKSKYLNDDESISKEFRYNRLNERYKTCVKCRSRETLRVKRLVDEASASDGKIKHCYRCYKNKAPDEFVCPNGKSYNACYSCLDRRYNKSEPREIGFDSCKRTWLDKILDPSSDEDEIWGGKQN